MKEQVAQRVAKFESRFMIHAREGLVVDWMAASNQDNDGFRQYIADRQLLRDFNLAAK